MPQFGFWAIKSADSWLPDQDSGSQIFVVANVFTASESTYRDTHPPTLGFLKGTKTLRVPFIPAIKGDKVF